MRKVARMLIFCILILTTLQLLNLGGSAQEAPKEPKRDEAGDDLGDLGVGAVLSIALKGGDVVDKFIRANLLCKGRDVGHAESPPENWYWRNGQVAIRYAAIRSGSYVELYNNKGTLLGRGRYLGVCPEGQWEWHDKKTTLKCTYDSGKVDGVCMWYRDGRMKEWCQYVGGSRHGLGMEIISDGDRNSQNWREGKLEGVSIEYRQGMPQKVEHYHKGKLHGLHIEYDKNGEVVVKGEYRDGVEVGEWFRKKK